MNKKGNLSYLVMIFLVFFVIMFVGFIMVIGSSIINWTFDEATPVLVDLGVMGDTNMTEIASMTITPLNNVVQSFTWLTGVLYVMMLIGSIGIAFIVRTTPQKWLMGFYFLLVIMLVMGSIFISNIYEDFQNDSGELATRLNEHTLLSFMLINSPMIFTAIAFITGIVLFSGMQEEEFV